MNRFWPKTVGGEERRRETTSIVSAAYSMRNHHGDVNNFDGKDKPHKQRLAPLPLATRKHVDSFYLLVVLADV